MRATGADWLVDLFVCLFVFYETVAIAPSKSMTRARPINLSIKPTTHRH